MLSIADGVIVVMVSRSSGSRTCACASGRRSARSRTPSCSRTLSRTATSGKRFRLSPGRSNASPMCSPRHGLTISDAFLILVQSFSTNLMFGCYCFRSRPRRTPQDHVLMMNIAPPQARPCLTRRLPSLWYDRLLHSSFVKTECVYANFVFQMLQQFYLSLLDGVHIIL